MTSEVFPKEEYEARWAKVQSEMTRRGYETAVIWSRGASSYDRCSNLLWLVNHYSGHPGQTPDNNLWQGRGTTPSSCRRARSPNCTMTNCLNRPTGSRPTTGNSTRTRSKAPPMR